MDDNLKSTTKVIIDDSGIQKFIKLFNSKKKITKENISELLNTSGYKNLIHLGGPNIGISSEETWFKLFNEAVKINECEIIEKYNNNTFKKNIIQVIYWAYQNINEIKKFNNKIVQEIKSNTFINIAKKFIPDEVNYKEIRINLVVGVCNCFGVGNEMIIDVSFLGKLTNKEISDILAHELHHMYRSKIEIQYNCDNKYKNISQALYWLESEGIADLCNFESTWHIYEDYGYIRKGSTTEILKNIRTFFEKLDDLLLQSINNPKYSNKMIEFLSNNIAFHSLGYTMAKQIERVLGIEEIKKCAGDKLVFFLTYYKASKLIKNTNDIYTFSDEVINGLQSIFVK